jgi:hypothetical protein
LSKFSSYPEHQLIFENWRKHCDTDRVDSWSFPPPPPNINEAIELKEVAPLVAVGGVAAAAALYGRVSGTGWVGWIGDVLAFLLSVAGVVPGIGNIPDIIAAVIYWVRGRPFMCIISLLSAIPAIGIGVRAVQLAAKVAKHPGKAVIGTIAGLGVAALGANWVSQAADLLKKELDKLSDFIKNAGQYIPGGGEHAGTASKTMRSFSDSIIQYFTLIFSEAGAEAGEDPASDAAPQQATQAATPVAGGGQAPPAKTGDKVVEIPGDRTYIYILHADGTSTAYKRGNPPKFFRGPFPKNSATSLKIAQNAK